MNIVKEITHALEQLGVKMRYSIKMEYVAKGSVITYIDGKYFGIWDEARKTFVD